MPLPQGKVYEHIAFGADGVLAASVGNLIHLISADRGACLLFLACIIIDVCMLSSWALNCCLCLCSLKSKRGGRECVRKLLYKPFLFHTHIGTGDLLEAIDAHDGAITSLEWCPRKVRTPGSAAPHAVLASSR